MLELWRGWVTATEQPSPENFDAVLKGYKSVVDSTAAITAKGLYDAYPNAKFILTTRDPVRWESSMRSTVFKTCVEFPQSDVAKTQPALAPIVQWLECFLNYFGGGVPENPQEELFRHNEYIKGLIPPEQLIVFDLKEGWEPLAKFLNVPIPEVPFPRLNDRKVYHERGW
ncbi:hypothetical protein M422DRAFT_264679 [Sphaerobolus stellatus SS14]|uniref:Protein-tyrosine sulfotransferase n=1 Tax=Sphaerobolus stellatus (strain SS14) TaxID=990650 RepID=A0A0C9UFB2_SPHS4|nr:hypothetical protein M422DRAFT_264679 [Sphaerobolus stellatus SS14]